MTAFARRSTAITRVSGCAAPSIGRRLSPGDGADYVYVAPDDLLLFLRERLTGAGANVLTNERLSVADQVRDGSAGAVAARFEGGDSQRVRRKVSVLLLLDLSASGLPVSCRPQRHRALVLELRVAAEVELAVDDPPALRIAIDHYPAVRHTFRAERRHTGEHMKSGSRRTGGDARRWRTARSRRATCKSRLRSPEPPSRR